MKNPGLVFILAYNLFWIPMFFGTETVAYCASQLIVALLFELYFWWRP